MALVKCPECSHSISDAASNCPKCGCPSGLRDEYVRRLLTATVRVECTNDKGGKTLGTGFIVGDGRFLVTAYHVVKAAKEIRAIRYHQPRESPLPHAEKIAVDSWSKGAYLIGIRKDSTEPLREEGSILLELPKTGSEVVWTIDISTLHLEAPFNNTSPLEFDKEHARIAEDVLFVGYPGGGVEFKPDYEDFPPLPLTTKAIVAFGTKYGLPPTEEFYYWLDRPSFPGNSGGPVMSLKTGKIIGVISATPFMPKTILTASGRISVRMPDGYAIAIGTAMLRESVEHTIKNESWRPGLKKG